MKTVLRVFKIKGICFPLKIKMKWMRGKTFLSYLHIHYMKAVIKNCGKSRKFKFNTPSWLSCVPRYLWLLGFPCMQPSYGFLHFSQRGFLPLDPIPWSQTCAGLLAPLLSLLRIITCINASAAVCWPHLSIWVVWEKDIEVGWFVTYSGIWGTPVR